MEQTFNIPNITLNKIKVNTPSTKLNLVKSNK